MYYTYAIHQKEISPLPHYVLPVEMTEFMGVEKRAVQTKNSLPASAHDAPPVKLKPVLSS